MRTDRIEIHHASDPSFSQTWPRSTTDDLQFGYQFTRTDEFADHTDPFSEGLKRLEAHDIINAVLLFEAAVQKQPDHAAVRTTTSASSCSHPDRRFRPGCI